MSPQLIRRIAMEIRQQRELLNVEARWAEEHKQTRDPLVRDTFDRVAFWRSVLRSAETALATD